MVDESKQKKNSLELTSRLKQQAVDLGFPLAGVATAGTPARLQHFWNWLDKGYSGQMQYLEGRRQAYTHPSSILQDCQSLLMLGVPYLASDQQRPSTPCPNDSGKVARYAQGGTDYHIVIRRRLKELKRWLIQEVPTAKVRGVVDTAPLLEREFAEAAGLGWIGKNTLLLNKHWGSYLFLAALLTDQPLEPDPSHETSHCGTCTACLDQCPTQAFPEAFVLDATRCISYLTIEQSGAVEPKLADATSGWIFGCDICQEVCPWNRKSLITADLTWQPQPAYSHLDVLSTLQLNQEEFEQTFRHTPLWRSGLHGMIRNAILVAGWQRNSEATELLVHLLSSDKAALRASAAWALGRIGGRTACKALEDALASEATLDVRDAIVQSLSDQLPTSS